MPSSVSVEAARRQSFGVLFNHSSKDTALAGQILAGTLHLSPHEPWAIRGEIDWKADPYGDKNWRAQLHMLRWLDPLRRRADKGDADSAKEWVRLAGSWVANNPPGRRSAPEAWLNMVDGIRALELCLAVPFVSETHPEALEWLIPSIRKHAEWIADERHLGHSNHALHQHQGLFVCGAVLQDDSAQDLAAARLERLFASEYDEQGANAEGSIMYHLANYNWWSMASRRLLAEGRALPTAMAVLDEVPIELAHATKPSGEFVSIGDTDGGSPSFVKHPATRWVTTGGADGEPPEDLIKIYDAGYVFARSGWGDQERDYVDETFWSASFGSAARVHGHPDGGSITFGSMGTEWITDPGKYQYGSSEMRDFCVSRASHSLPVITDRPYDPESFVACTRREVTDSHYDLTFTDTGYQGATVTRRVVYSVTGEYLVVIDNIASVNECTAIQNWQCGKGVEATPTDRGYALSSGASQAAILFTGSAPRREAVKGEERPPAGWVSTGWKQREAAPAIRFIKSGRRFRFITLIAAGFKGQQPSLATVEGTPAGQIRLRVDSGRVAEQIVITNDAVTFVPYAAEATVAVEPLTPKDKRPALDNLDNETRARIFTLTRRARKAAWDSPDAVTRGKLSRELSGILDKYSLPHGVDLGLNATISDLRCVSHAKVDRREVLKHRPGLINWESKDPFRTSHVNAPTTSVYGAISDLPPLNRPTMVTYTLGSLVLPALVTPAPGDTLTVMLQTAVDRARTHLPLFQRVRFQGELGAGPSVAFADPTLDLSSELRLGWYLGNEEIDLPKSIAKAIVKLGQHLGTEKVVLQGGSGGGFAALQIGAHIPGAHVVAANPQTDLRRYNAKAYRAAMVSAFGRKDVGNKSELIPRISVMRRLQDLNSQLDVTLVMNSGDVYHERNHAAPLREAAEQLDGITMRNVSFDLGPGHKGLSNDLYGQVMLDLYERIGTVSPSLASRDDL